MGLIGDRPIGVPVNGRVHFSQTSMTLTDLGTSFLQFSIKTNYAQIHLHHVKSQHIIHSRRDAKRFEQSQPVNLMIIITEKKQIMSFKKKQSNFMSYISKSTLS